MKRILTMALAMALVAAPAALAQSDDVYFVPSKADKQDKAAQAEGSAVGTSSYTPLPPSQQQGSGEYDTWADGREGGPWDVDAYNRRTGGESQQRGDSLAAQEGYAEGGGYAADNSCTSLIVRFHSPTVGVYVSSPYYLDFYDPWFSPWGYDPWWGWPASWWGWGWPASYYGWGWRPWGWGYGGWYGGWYDPWYAGWGWGPSWGWYPPHHHGPSYAWNAQRGPRGGFVAYGNRPSSSRPSAGSSFNRPSGNRYAGYRPSRNFGTGGSRPSRSYNNSRPSRNFGTTTTSPSRSFGNGNNGNRSFSSPSRSFGGGGGSYSSPSRSFGGGGGGGARGGGRSFGGRR